MTSMDFSITEDTQATLLLCAALGKDNGDVRPLTLPQYNADRIYCAVVDFCGIYNRQVQALII